MVRSNRFFLVNFSRRDFVEDFVQARNPKLLPVGYRHSLIADDIVTRGPIRPFVTKKNCSNTGSVASYETGKQGRSMGKFR